MNKFQKVILSIQKVMLSIIAGIEVTFYIFIPILISVLWINVFELGKIYSYFFYGIGFLATLFRAIKIGWMK